MRGQSETEHGECKKIASFSLTPTVIGLLSQISKSINIYRSELIERFTRCAVRLMVDLEDRESTPTVDSEVCTDLAEVTLESLKI